MTIRAPSPFGDSSALVEKFLSSSFDALMRINANLDAILAAEAAAVTATEKAAEVQAALVQVQADLAAIQAIVAANQALTGAEIAALLDAHLGSADWRQGGAAPLPMPSSLGALADQTYSLNAGIQTVNASVDFSNAVGGTWSVAGAGATINQSGVVTIPTTSLLAGVVVTVTYTNTTGAAQSAFQVTVQNAPVVTHQAFIPAGSDGLTAAGEEFNVRI